MGNSVRPALEAIKQQSGPLGWIAVLGALSGGYMQLEDMIEKQIQIFAPTKEEFLTLKEDIAEVKALLSTYHRECSHDY